MGTEQIAQSLNKLRAFPRLMCLMYGWMSADVYMWYIALPDPSNAQSAAFSTTMAAAVGFFKFYVDSGNKQ